MKDYLKFTLSGGGRRNEDLCYEFGICEEISCGNDGECAHNVRVDDDSFMEMFRYPD